MTMPTTPELEAALKEFETHLPGLGVLITVFDGSSGQTICNRNDQIAAEVIGFIYENRIRVPTTLDTLQ